MVSTGLTRASADHWEPFANRCHEIPPLDRRDIPTGNIAFKIQTRITDLGKDINAKFYQFPQLLSMLNVSNKKIISCFKRLSINVYHDHSSIVYTFRKVSLVRRSRTKILHYRFNYRRNKKIRGGN